MQKQHSGGDFDFVNDLKNHRMWLCQNADTCVVWVGGISHSGLGLAKLEMFVLDGNNQITQESVNNKKEKQTEK